MARVSYGKEVQKRAKALLAVLLLYANDELDGDEVTLDGLRSHIQVRWLSSTRLVVRTKVRFLQVLSGLGGEYPALSPDQIKEAIKRWTDFLEILEDNRVTKGGSENWHFTLNLWCDRSDISANLQRFDREWEGKREGGRERGREGENKSQVASRKSQLEERGGEGDKKQEKNILSAVFWQDICHKTLTAQHQQRLTTNPLTSVDGVSFDVDEVYVPLGLVERKQRERRSGEIRAVEGSQLYEADEGEITETFSSEEFFERVLSASNSNRLAIIGEPGAGKTTLLQRIALWVLNNTNYLPVWVSLADLQGQNLEDYLLGNWLRGAIRKRHVPQEMEEAFCEQFNLGRVWLLLDAVDEMAMESSHALSQIASFLTGWIADARVVLTCRLNVWDGGKNFLEDFDTYRNLNFSYGGYNKPDQVSLFIQGWFRDNPQLAANLRSELDRPGRRRIKDAVKNPLRLALLCRTWGLGQGELPNTKAMLYEQFVETIYTWKQDRFPTTSTQRYNLNQALGKLALQAMSQEKTKFRLSHRFLNQVFSQSDRQMWELALQLGWLNHVGISESQGEKLYAFYHPTFQEYFAALAIDNWRFFLNPDIPNSTTNPSHSQRIFDPEWREVILLWLGREDIPQPHKEEFIYNLINFQDGCGGFYSYQAYFIAAIAISEFADCSYSQEIVNQLIKWRFGHYHPQFQKIWRYPPPITEGARTALIRSDRKLAITALEQYIQTSDNHFDIWNAAYSLGRTYDPGNAIAIAALEKLVNTLQRYENLRWQAANSLGRIDPGNAIAINALIEIIQSCKKPSIRRKAAFSLGKADTGNQLAISTLEQVITTSNNPKLQQQIAENLQIIDPENPIAAEILSLTEISSPPQTVTKNTKKPNSAREISALIQKILSSPDEDAKRRRACRLAKADPGNEIAFSTLVYLVKSAKSEIVRKRTADNFKKLLLDSQIPELIAALKSNFSELITETEQEQYRDCYKLLWHCSEKISYQQFYQAWHQMD